LAISKKAKAEKGRKGEREKGRKGDRRQSRRLKLFIPIYRCGIKNITLDFGFVIWNLRFGILLIYRFLANLAVYSSKTQKIRLIIATGH